MVQCLGAAGAKVVRGVGTVLGCTGVLACEAVKTSSVVVAAVMGAKAIGDAAGCSFLSSVDLSCRSISVLQNAEMDAQNSTEAGTMSLAAAAPLVKVLIAGGARVAYVAASRLENKLMKWLTPHTPEPAHQAGKQKRKQT